MKIAKPNLFKMILLFCVLTGCGVLPKPVEDGNLAINCDTQTEDAICLKKKNLTTCKPICVDENKRSAWVVTENGQKYCDLEKAVLYEVHCIEAHTTKEYVVTPNQWLTIEHHFSWYSDKEVFEFLADHEFECLKGLCNDNEYESLEYMKEFLREKAGPQ